MSEKSDPSESLHQLNRALFETMPLGVVYQNADGEIVAANPAAQEIFGLSLDQLRGRTSFDPRWRSIHEDGSNFPGEDHPAMQALRTGQVVCDVVMGVYHPLKNAYRWINITATPQSEKPGDPPNTVIATFEDITKRKQAEEKLRSSERILQLFVDNAPAAIAMFDRDMKYLAASRRYLAAYKLGNQNIIGRSHYEVFPEIPERWKEIHRRCLAGAVEKSEEDPFPRENGSLDWVAWEIHPWYQDDLEIGGIVLFSDVITERKQAKEALLASERKFFVLFDDAPFAAALSRMPAGVMLHVNNAWVELYGYSKEDAVGKTTLDLNIILDEAGRAGIIAQLQEHGLVRDQEVASWTRSGELRVLSLNIDLIDIDGVQYALSMAQDITERKRAEKQVLQLTRLYATLSQINQMIMRVTDHQELFDGVCHVAAEFGRFKTVWLGLYDSASGQVTLAASSGPLSFREFNIHEPPFADGISSSALKTGRITYLSNVQTKLGLERWWESSLQSAAAIPLRAKGQLMGLMILTSDEKDFFIAEQEQKLLEEIGQDISFALDMLENEAQRKQAEEDVLRSRTQLEAALASMTDAVFISDTDGNFTEFNHAFATFHRFRTKEECAKTLKEYPNFLEVYLPDGTLAPLEMWAVPRALRGEMATSAEYTLRRIDTAETWVGSYSFAPIRSHNGQIVGTVVVGRDITEIKQAETLLRQSETQLRESEAKYRLLAENISDVIWVLDLQTLRYRYVSPSVTLLRGYTVEEVMAHGIADSLVPTSAQHLNQILPARLEEWKNGVSRSYTDELELPCKDGGTVWTETTTRLVLNPETEHLEIYGVWRDISERKLAQAELDKTQRQLLLTIRSGNIGLWDWELRTNHVFYSPEWKKQLGYEEHEIAGDFSEWESRLHPEDIERANTTVRDYLERPYSNYVSEFRMRHKDGSYRWILAQASLIMDEQGRPVRMMGSHIDITQHKDTEAKLQAELAARMQAELALQLERDSLARRVEERTAELSLANAELVRANHAKDEFLSTMSHELRTPLNAILNLSESLQEGVYEAITPRQRHILGAIHESGEHLLNLINDILDVSKAEAGRIELQPEPVDLNGLIESALRLINPQAMKKRLRIFTAFDSNLGTIAADGRRLKQMLVNLLSNAVKFTPQGGQIGLEITRESEGESIRFTVWDSGIGIPADKIALLFQPFVQLDTALSREYAGTGLGLALVRRLAELHGGSVGVESEPGKGSRFWFIIPVIQVVGSAGAGLAEIAGEDQAIFAPRRALIIEDSAAAADHIARYLNELNTEVIIHPYGDSAVQTAVQAKPDVILLDIVLPDTSGWQVLASLKTNPHTREIPVVIISVVDERKRGISLGAVEYLLKPITREQLHMALLKASGVKGKANRVMLIRPVATVENREQTPESGALILFAEDNLTNLEVYIDYLKSKGYRVIPAINGYEAIERSQEFNPDLILMDIQMPAMDGLEAIRRLRAMPEFANVPIIALTALAMPGDRERCLAAGANAYLSKPISLKLLMQEIQKFLG